MVIMGKHDISVEVPIDASGKELTLKCRKRDFAGILEVIIALYLFHARKQGFNAFWIVLLFLNVGRKGDVLAYTAPSPDPFLE